MDSTVAGMRLDHCAAAVTRMLRACDPHARITVDLAAGPVAVPGAGASATAVGFPRVADRAEDADVSRHEHRRTA